MLTAKLPDGDIQTYAFDPVGNRLTLQDHRGLRRYRYDPADQLLDVESDFNPEEPPATPASLAWASAGMSDASVSKPLFRTSYSFDSDGNEVGKVGPGNRKTEYGFNNLDRLVSVSSPGSAPVRYGYNADGQRVVTDSHRYLRMGRGRPILAELSGNKITTRYIFLPGGQLLARVGPDDSKRVFYHFDALGSTVAQSDPSARVVARFSYDPYGARRSFSVSGERFGFVGGESVADENSDLLEMGVRFYGSGTGRFLSVDPLIGPVFSEVLSSSYLYARDNPTTWNDPSGLWNPVDPWADVPAEMNPYAQAKACYELAFEKAKKVADAAARAAAAAAKSATEVLAAKKACEKICSKIKNPYLFGLCEAACHAIVIIVKPSQTGDK